MFFTCVGQLSSVDLIISPVVNNLPVDYLFFIIQFITYLTGIEIQN